MRHIIGVLAASMLLAACGSGSTVTLPQQKKANLVFSAYTSASLTEAVKSISISARIPAGVILPIEPGQKRQVATAALVSYKKTGSIIGNYSAPVLRIQVFDATSISGLGLDNVRQFAGIILPVMDSVTESSFTGINPSFPEFSAFGVTPGNTVDLTSKLKPAMKVTF